MAPLVGRISTATLAIAGSNCMAWPHDIEVPVFFLEPKRRLGTIVNIAGKSGSSGPVTVPPRVMWNSQGAAPRSGWKAGSEVSRPLSRSPWSSHPAHLRRSRDQADEGRLAADQDYLSRIDPINYVDGLVSDGQGRMVFPALIPKVTYRIYDNTTDNDNAGRRLRKEFTVKPGETLDLGDIRIEKPQS